MISTVITQNKILKFNDFYVPVILPIFQSNINTNSYECKLALEGIYEEFAKQYTIESNLKTLFMSSWYSHKKNDKFIPLVNFITDCCNSLIKNYYNQNYCVECDNCWGAIYEDGDFAKKHHHYPSIFSSILYIELENNYSNIFFDKTEVTIKKGDIIIFPGIINHEVLPTKGKRIIVSMNFSKKNDTQ